MIICFDVYTTGTVNGEQLCMCTCICIYHSKKIVIVTIVVGVAGGVQE